MRLRATIGFIALATVGLGAAGGGAASAQAATTCTWGGTPAAPTGLFTNNPGITNIPSAGPIDFTATGRLAGGGRCRGRMTFTGRLDAGATCAEGTFAGTVKGLPGVVRFAGVNASGVVPSRLYDRAGNVVGSENAQLLTVHNAPFTDCNTPQGFTRGNFSSVIELL